MALQPRQRCLENIVRNEKRLQEWLGIPLLLENNNYHPTNAYEYMCEPEPAAGWSMKSAATRCSTWRTLRSALLIWGGQTHATICWPYL